GDRVKRREFIMLLGGAATWPLAAGAQQSAKLPIIGYLGATTLSLQGKWTAAFVQRLRELGWDEGRTVALEYRWAQGSSERADESVAEFVRRKVDVIVASGGANVAAAARVTSVIPIVFPAAGDRLALASLRVWRIREATSPAYRSSKAISEPSGLKFCASSF